MRIDYLGSVLEALDIAAETLEGESERTENEGFPGEAKQEALKAKHYRDLKRFLVNAKVIMVKSEDMS